MGGDVLQEGMVIEGHGEVRPPPDLSVVIARIREAAIRKQSLELMPGELRVLVGLLDADD